MKNYKSFFTSKIFIAIVFAALGVGTTVLAQNIKSQHHKQEDVFLNMDKMIKEHQKHFFSSVGDDSIFKEMTAMEERMDEIFKTHRKYMREAFIKAEKENKGTNKINLATKEDEENYYYELYFSGIKKENILVEIKDNNLNFSAKQEDKNSASSFYYSLALPKYNSGKEPDIKREENRVIVALKK